MLNWNEGVDMRNCKMCGSLPVYKHGFNHKHWECTDPFCGVIGPDDDVSGDKWNKLMGDAEVVGTREWCAEYKSLLADVKVASDALARFLGI